MTTTETELPAPEVSNHGPDDDPTFPLRARIGELNSDIDLLRSDIERIGQALLTEANERGWCAEYDEFVENLNSRLIRGGTLLPTRAVTYRVTFTCTTAPESVSDLEGAIDRALRDMDRGNCGDFEYEPWD